MELLLLEALQSDFSLDLRDVTVHDFDVLLDFLAKQELIGFPLRLSEHDTLATSVDNEDVGEG